MKARVHITLKDGVLDPQGKTIAQALGSLGFSGVNDVRQGKYIELDIEAASPGAAQAEVEMMLADAYQPSAQAEVERMCSQLLANTVIENYQIEIES